jgi:hypothetical protein
MFIFSLLFFNKNGPMQPIIASGDPLHCYDNAFVVLVLGRSTPSFYYNKDIKGKGVERWWKELERNKRKVKWDFT